MGSEFIGKPLMLKWGLSTLSSYVETSEFKLTTTVEADAVVCVYHCSHLPKLSNTSLSPVGHTELFSSIDSTFSIREPPGSFPVHLHGHFDKIYTGRAFYIATQTDIQGSACHYR